MSSTTNSNGFSRRSMLGALAALPAFPALLGAIGARAEDAAPLPSWNDGPAKQAILKFVHATTDAGSPEFVPPEERIATFDQDGTLWVEYPIYTQLVYCFDRVPELVEGQARACKRRAVQGRAIGGSRGDRKTVDGRPHQDRRRDADGDRRRCVP